MQRPWRSAADWLALPAFLKQHSATPNQGTMHSKLYPPPKSITPTGQFGSGIYSIEVPSSQMTTAYVRLTLQLHIATLLCNH